MGTSRRGSLALLKLSRAWAATDGRAFVRPDDVKRFAPAVLGHRLILDPGLWSAQRSELAVVEEVVQGVPVPVIAEGR
ncbi:MAG: hypothetical protein QM767_00290 [Anaeromyxobacter sp.]